MILASKASSAIISLEIRALIYPIVYAIFMRTFITLTLFSLLFIALSGCYQIAPEEGEISTVPITNNPNAMPGSMRSSSMPSMF